jgi:hypothetical protein
MCMVAQDSRKREIAINPNVQPYGSIYGHCKVDSMKGAWDGELNWVGGGDLW